MGSFFFLIVVESANRVNQELVNREEKECILPEYGISRAMLLFRGIRCVLRLPPPDSPGGATDNITEGSGYGE